MNSENKSNLEQQESSQSLNSAQYSAFDRYDAQPMAIELTDLKTGSTVERLKQLFEYVVLAIRGTQLDYTHIKLSKAIFLLALPMALEMLMESLFGIVDIFFVASLGADAVAVVGITESLMTIFYALCFGLTMGATSVISRRIGEKNNDEASKSAMQAIILGVAISLVVAMPGLFFSKEILTAMGANSLVVEEYHGYLTIILGLNIIIMLLFINNAIFRAAGDAAISFRVLFLANVLNIILDPLMIFGIGPFPEMGVVGAAIATCTGRSLAVVYQFYQLLNGKSRIKLILKQIRIELQVILKILRLSATIIGQYLIATSSWLLLMRIVSDYGSQDVAAYTIALRIMVFILLPSGGIANAAATLMGQNLGAGKPERSEQAVWTTIIINIIFLGVVSLFFLVFPEFFVSLFISEADVVSVGADCLRIISAGFVFYGTSMVIIHAMNGAGDTTTPTKLNIVFFWLVELPLAFVLAKWAGLESLGVYWAILIAEAMFAVTSVLLFRRGKWKTAKV